MRTGQAINSLQLRKSALLAAERFFANGAGVLGFAHQLPHGFGAGLVRIVANGELCIAIIDPVLLDLPGPAESENGAGDIRQRSKRKAPVHMSPGSIFFVVFDCA